MLEFLGAHWWYFGLAAVVFCIIYLIIGFRFFRSIKKRMMDTSFSMDKNFGKAFDSMIALWINIAILAIMISVLLVAAGIGLGVALINYVN